MKVKELVRLLIDAHADDVEVVYDANWQQVVLAPNIDVVRTVRPQSRVCPVSNVGRVVECQVPQYTIEGVN